METDFWQTRVKITQIPSILDKQIILNPRTMAHIEIEKSWFSDPFLDKTVYGLELTLNKQFSWVFFMHVNTKSEAIRKGYSFLMHLKENFSGLTGEVDALPIDSFNLNQNYPIYEFVFPRRPYLNTDKFSIINKIVQIFQSNNNNLFQLFIFWQKDDSVDGTKVGKNSPFELYKVKIFIRILVSKASYSEEEYQKAELMGQLDYLTININNLLGEHATLKQTSINTWRNIVESDVFWVNHFDEHTGSYYKDICKQLPEEKVPAFIIPSEVDFTFSENLPLPKAFNLPNENVKYVHASEDDRGYILIGNVVNQGVLTKNIKTIPINHFAHSVIITGQTGTGKTHLLGHICKEFYIKSSDIGVLILNLGKGKQEGFYKADKIIKYPSPELRVSYFYKGDYLEKSLQETASYLIASLGLKNIVDKIMYLVMKSFIRVNGDLPSSLKDLFNGLKKWFKTYRYHKKFQTNILRAIQNRVLTLLSDPLLDKTLEYSPNSGIPQWFQGWRNGKTIYIDLSMCNIYVKRLLTSAIFQMIKTLTPDVEAGRLQNIIVIDEAHQITEKPITSNPDNDDFISREQLEKIFTNLLREFRSKGLSFILVDPTPHRLFSCVTTIPSLKILFRLSQIDNRLFTGNLKVQDYLTLLKNRHAVILNGNNEEMYVIKTPDYFYTE